MTRPRTIDDEAIFKAVRRLVTAQGLAVSTRAIALEAGISEAVLFQRFSSKQKLLEAALGCPRVDFTAVAAAAEGTSDTRAALEGMALAILAEFRRILPTLLPVLGDPTTGLRATLWAHDGPLLSCVRDLEAYLSREKERGRLSAESPHAVAFLIVSALHSAALFETLHGERRASDAGIRVVIGDIWNGLRTRRRR